MKQDINLSTDNIELREQDMMQKIDIPIPEDTIYQSFNIANHDAYVKQTSFQAEKNYLPKTNTDLQYIAAKIQYDQIMLLKPKFIYVMLYVTTNNEQIPVLKLKKQIVPASDYKYNPAYGFKYGVVYDDYNNENMIIWSDKFFYDSNAFFIEWKFNTQQMNIIKQNYNPENPFKFKMRYAPRSNQNNAPIWNGWSRSVNNIFINTPPNAPINVELKEVREQI